MKIHTCYTYAQDDFQKCYSIIVLCFYKVLTLSYEVLQIMPFNLAHISSTRIHVLEIQLKFNLCLTHIRWSMQCFLSCKNRQYLLNMYLVFLVFTVR